ncbi:flavin-containing monooxygenase 5-like [Littorina saxatilis]|uniref:Flavin-containing monooxygenase n=1 Tax=Littorina saxatilis TaxID=31220 RepID=A0AAN9AKU4_9CAEN
MMRLGGGGKRVVVVGAGSSGLTAIKTCLEDDVTPLCLEKTQRIGGLWNYSPLPSAPHTAGIYESLVINTCREMMAFSDFPVPQTFPQFMTHRHVMQYFRQYADHFGLLPYIRFNTEVRHVRKADDYDVTGRWMVTYVVHVDDACPMKCVNEGGNDVTSSSTGSACQCDREGEQQGERERREEASPCNPCSSADENQDQPETEGRRRGACREVREEFDGVMICSGHHTVPYVPDLPGMGTFQGQTIHSQQYKRPEPFRGQRVLVVGIGNSAVDIASDLAKTASKVYLSTRRGAWVVPRTALWGVPADMVANSRLAFSLPLRLLEWCVEKQADARIDHTRVGLRPKHGLLGAHPTINDELPAHLLNGRVEVRPHVASLSGREVAFEDGLREEVDTVILATGYDYRLDFVSPDVIQVAENRVRLYKYVFPPRLPHASLAVIGLVQAIGAVMPIAEIQSRWAVSLLLGRVKLPDTRQMEEEIERRERTMDAEYYASRRHTLQTFWIEYMDEVAMEFGAKPDLLAMLWRDPGLALRCFLGPCLPAQYRLTGPRPWPHAPAFIRQLWHRTTARPQHLRDPDGQSPPRNGEVGGARGAEGGGATDEPGGGTGEEGVAEVTDNEQVTNGHARFSAEKSPGSSSALLTSLSVRSSWRDWLTPDAVWLGGVFHFVYLLAIALGCFLWLLHRMS